MSKPSKSVIANVVVALFAMLLVGGCIAVDYTVFTSEFPQAGVFEYLWSRLFR